MDVGAKLPALKAAASGGGTVALRDFVGAPLVVYFYPKDATPGCTLEAQDFRDLHAKFRRAGAVVVGVSKDSVASHDKFCGKQSLPFPLLSDADGALCEAFDVIRDKTLYGRSFRGIERSTFLFDASGILRRAWRKVRVAGHAEEVLEAVRALGTATTTASKGAARRR